MIRDLEWLIDGKEALDRVFFLGEVHDVRIRWMRFRRTTTTFRYGCYWADTRMVEVNPVLQHEWVPDIVVMSTIYHELLHAVHGREHSPAFRNAEMRFPHMVLDELWRGEHLNELIAARPPRRRT